MELDVRWAWLDAKWAGLEGGRDLVGERGELRHTGSGNVWLLTRGSSSSGDRPSDSVDVDERRCGLSATESVPPEYSTIMYPSVSVVAMGDAPSSNDCVAGMCPLCLPE